MSRIESERNNLIYRAHRELGISSYELSRIFQITPPRITAIVQRIEAKKEEASQ